MILAGGRSSRMGGANKILCDLGGRPIIDHVIDRLAPQVDRLVVNANDDVEALRTRGLIVVADSRPDRPGPLAGFAAGLDWAGENGFDGICLAAGDTPFLPLDLVSRLATASRDADRPTVAHAGDRLHPIFACLPICLRGPLRAHLAAGGSRRVADWLEAQGAIPVSFDDPGAFFNINTPEDLAAARIRLAAAAREPSA